MEKTLAEIKFLVEGITCTGCAMDMENIILGNDGVEEAVVNYKDSTFFITYDPDVIKTETIVKKVKKLGLTTKLITEA